LYFVDLKILVLVDFVIVLDLEQIDYFEDWVFVDLNYFLVQFLIRVDFLEF
jgi:hypothetical protein